jgi:hypothetical protein
MEGRVADRAFTLAEMASDESVRMSILAGREGRFSRAAPLNEPPVTYLQETEAPVYLLTNAKRGIGRGVKRNTVSPEGDYRTVVLVTGRRTLCLVGQSGEDVTIPVPHESVTAAEYHTGYRKHRLVLRTPRSAFHCWVHRKTPTALLDRVTEFVNTHRADEPDALEGAAPSQVTYRGQPVGETAISNGDSTAEAVSDGGSTEAESDETSPVMYRGEPIERE